jgi:tricorn protease
MSFKNCLFICLGFICSITYGQQKGYYRTPCIHGNTVVFTAEGDLWKFDISSHITARLTTDAGVEQNPVISPDGKQLAFLGEYEGVREVYLMDINGGMPKRLTYDFGLGLFLSGWTKDGKILYRTGATSSLPNTQLLKLDPATGKKEIIPLFEASLGCYGDDGVLYFTRFENQGSKTKRYKGGWIEQVWRFDGSHEASNLTGDFDGTSTGPMFYNGRIYFISDRDGTINLWSMDTAGKDLKQHTFSKGWDLQTPALDGGKIVYQKGADIWLYDISSGQESMLDISLISDFDQRKTKWITNPANSISYSDISPDGNYVAIVSRGRVFVSPAKSDRWVEVIPKSGIRARDVHFINNKSLAVLTDQAGEYEVFKVNADGSNAPAQITQKSKTIIDMFKVSPDDKYIAYSDKNEDLHLAETATGEVKFEFKDSYGGIADLSWSPNSRFLNVTQAIENTNLQISTVDTKTMKITPITTERLNSSSPSWSADGKWLFFVSERNLVSKTPSPWGSRQPEPYYTETAGIFAMPLDTAAKFPFVQTDSWLNDSTFSAVIKQDTAKPAKKGKATAAPEKTYDWNFAKSALYEVPVKSGNIGNMAVVNGYLYWLAFTDDGGKLYALKIEESKKYEPTEVATRAGGFDVSANGKKLLVKLMDGGFLVVDANGQKADADKGKLELAHWTFAIDPQQEWHEMFDDTWRMMRDYFYDKNLHGVDWVAVKNRYEPLLSRITDRYELDDLIGQMVGELSALHTFVGGGDKRRSMDHVQTGFLGAVLTKTEKGVRIDHIYKSDPDYMFSSPLNRPELRIKEGDVITAVNNLPLSQVNDIGELLADKMYVPVKLSLLNGAGKPYEQVIKPFSAGDAYNLRYDEWTYKNRLKVDSSSANDIGYIHLKAMSGSDMDDFVKQYYPIFNRKGLILDVRDNFGGNIDSWVLEKLLRKAWMYWQGRAGGPAWNMPYAFTGHMVLLCNQETCSDGEAISEGFRRLGLGKVIGMRTWGGEIWLSFDNTMVDNGVASAAELGVYGGEGKWLIEGHGVDPDIVVDNLPFETFKGKDAQLETAIAYLKKQIAEQPVVVPPAPKHPDKSFKYQ